MSIICQGLTTKFSPCKNKVKSGCFCHLHKIQFVEFYVNPDDTWPAPFQIRLGLIKYTRDTDPSIIYELIGKRIDDMIEVYPSGNNFEHKKLHLFICELIKFNVDILYEHDSLFELTNCILNELQKFEFLSDYLLDFKKKCVKSYRHQSQKKLAHFYMNHIDGLNRDVVEYIMSFY
jgi:hypothetical protein